jgi:hypothetical protein
MAIVVDAPATRIGAFAAMSAALTGFTADVIAPDNTLLSAHLLHVIDELAGATSLDQLLARFAALQAQGHSAQDIANVMLGVSPSSHAPAVQLAQSVLKLWYLGSWYPPGSTSAFNGDVVSGHAYVSGLAWRALQTHAMGDNPFVFGDWTSPPPPLAEFGADLA